MNHESKRRNITLRCLLLISCFFFCCSVPAVWANDNIPEDSEAVVENVIQHESSSTQHAWRSLGMVLLFLGTLFVLSWVVRKRAGSLSLRTSKRIRILEKVAVGNRHSLVLISLDGKDYLLGVGPQTVSTVTQTECGNLTQTKNAIDNENAHQKTNQ